MPQSVTRWHLISLYFLLPLCRALAIQNEAVFATNTSTTLTMASSEPEYHICTSNEESPILSNQDCSDAFLQLDRQTTTHQRIDWGTDNPLFPGHLPQRYRSGQCELSLFPTARMRSAKWRLSSYDVRIVEVIRECVRAGPKRGGYTMVGPPNHQVLASFTSPMGFEGAGVMENETWAIAKA